MAGHSTTCEPRFASTHIQVPPGGFTKDCFCSRHVCQQSSKLSSMPSCSMFLTKRVSAAEDHWMFADLVGHSGGPVPTTPFRLTVLSWGVALNMLSGSLAFFKGGIGTDEGSTSEKPYTSVKRRFLGRCLHIDRFEQAWFGLVFSRALSAPTASSISLV